jgi:hypothetical protein
VFVVKANHYQVTHDALIILTLIKTFVVYSSGFFAEVSGFPASASLQTGFPLRFNRLSGN